MDRKQLIKAYIDFFKSKGHKQIPNSSLIPENDPTVLFTTAGMHPIVPYLLSQPHPLGKRLCNVQRCIRTGDIDEVGDSTHLTFFEMLGNWSLGDYWKKQAIEYSFEFLTKVLKIPLNKLAITCFIGNKNAEKDIEAAKVWMSLKIPKERIVFLEEDNWWGPAGKTGPCGPCTEQFYWKPNNIPAPKIFNPKDKNWVEIGNDVLMQYNKDEKGKYDLAKQKNIDFGGGVERTITILSGLNDVYLSSTFLPIIKQIEKLSNKKYGKDEGETRAMRIIADHIKASVFIIADGTVPSNSEQGYVLRRLIRRTIRYAKNLGIKSIIEISEPIFEIYNDYNLNKKKIKHELEKEETRFLETIERGMKIFEKLVKDKKQMSGKDVFLLYQSYGFPIELTREIAKEKQIKIDEKAFQQELLQHQELSRTATVGKFKSGLADNSDATKKLHTATHLLNAALRKVLKNPDIYQKGSNITPERLRFDFNFDRKLTDEEIKKVEELVNQKIIESIPIVCELMNPKQAKEKGAQGVFDEKYGEKVSVYSAGNFSKEICAGPHVENTSELEHFKIIKEESVAAGVRRIKAILE
ncbi:MAG: alanine--tRNA ligase [Nanoarchaeota archaeon]